MLTQLHIRDFAIIDHLELELAAGMGVLTGETGAGKSILIDALGLVLGDRADAAMIRAGAERLEISAAFELSAQPTTRAWLEEQALEEGAECWLRRVVMQHGRSRAYINGTPVSAAMLRTLGAMLIEIHGQHEHQSLMHPTMQRRLLDVHAGHHDDLAALARCFDEYQRLQSRLAALSDDQTERQDRIDLLRFQIQELEQLGLATGEWQELEQAHARLAHAEQLKTGVFAIVQALAEDESQDINTLLGAIITQLEALNRHDTSLSGSLELLTEAQTSLHEAAGGLRRYAEALEVDDEELARVEERLGAARELARKHRLDEAELPGHLERLRAELATLDNPAEDLEALRAQLVATETRYRELAGRISQQRQQTAARLDHEVTQTLQTLGMEGAGLHIRLDTTTGPALTRHGRDTIEFTVRTNTGQPYRPLQKIASGGELARISLALQIIAGREMSVPTLIFDEVDAGVGGAVAEVVGRRLRAVGEETQVLCVTHLPQVAAQAHAHFRLSKHTEAGNVITRVEALEPAARIDETARMLGGIELTAQTRAHAREMIEQAHDTAASA